MYENRDKITKHGFKFNRWVYSGINITEIKLIKYKYVNLSFVL